MDLRSFRIGESCTLVSWNSFFCQVTHKTIEKYRTVVYCYFSWFLRFYHVYRSIPFYLIWDCYATLTVYYLVGSNGFAFHAHPGKRFWKAYIVEGGCLNHQSTITWYLVVHPNWIRSLYIYIYSVYIYIYSVYIYIYLFI